MGMGIDLNAMNSLGEKQKRMRLQWTFFQKQFARDQGGQSPCQIEHCRPTNKGKNSEEVKRLRQSRHSESVGETPSSTRLTSCV